MYICSCIFSIHSFSLLQLLGKLFINLDLLETFPISFSPLFWFAICYFSLIVFCLLLFLFLCYFLQSIYFWPGFSLTHTQSEQKCDFPLRFFIDFNCVCLRLHHSTADLRNLAWIFIKFIYLNRNRNHIYAALALASCSRSSRSPNWPQLPVCIKYSCWS